MEPHRYIMVNILQQKDFRLRAVWIFPWKLPSNLFHLMSILFFFSQAYCDVRCSALIFARAVTECTRTCFCLFLVQTDVIKMLQKNISAIRLACKVSGVKWGEATHEVWRQNHSWLAEAAKCTLFEPVHIIKTGQSSGSQFCAKDHSVGCNTQWLSNND